MSLTLDLLDSELPAMGAPDRFSDLAIYNYRSLYEADAVTRLLPLLKAADPQIVTLALSVSAKISRYNAALKEFVDMRLLPLVRALIERNFKLTVSKQVSQAIPN